MSLDSHDADPAPSDVGLPPPPPPPDSASAAEGDPLYEAPAEAQRDLTEQLSRFDDMDSSGGAADYGLSEPQFGTADPLAHVGGYDLQSAPEDPLPPPARRPVVTVTLDSLMSRYGGALQSRQYHLSIERVRPKKTITGQSCSGWLEDVSATLTHEQMRQRYGGGTFTVTVIAPERSADGREAFKRLAALSVEIAGDPIPPPQRERRERMYEKPAAVAVAESRMRHDFVTESRRSEREAHQELRRVEREQYGDLQSLVDTVATPIRRQLTEQTTFLQKQYDQLKADTDDQIKKLREKNAALEEESGGLKRAAIEAGSRAAQEADRRLTHETNRLRSEHRAELDRQRSATQALETRVRGEAGDRHRDTVDEHVRQLTEARRLHETQRIDLESRSAKERDSIRQEYTGRLDQQRQHHTDQMAQLRLQMDQRVADAGRVSEQMDRMRFDTSQSAIKSLESNAKTRQSMTDQTYQMRENTMLERIGRLEEEVTGLRAENSMLSGKINKPLGEQIADAKAITDLVGGGPPEKEDWKTTAFKMMGDGLKELPTVIKQVSEERAAAQQRAAQPGPPPGWQPPPPHQLQQRPVHHHQPVPQQRRAPMAPPPPGWQPPVGMGPSTPVVAHSAEDAMVGPPQHPQPQPQAPAQAKAEAPAKAAQVRAQPPPEPPPAAAPAATPAAAPAAASRPLAPPPGSPPAPSPDPPAQPAPPQAAFTQAQFDEFLEKLEGSIKGGIIDAEMFAKGLISTVGAPVASAIIQHPADQLVEAVRNAHPTATIATPGGRTYVREVWRIVGEELTAGQA